MQISQTANRVLMLAASVDRLDALYRPIEYFTANKNRQVYHQFLLFFPFTFSISQRGSGRLYEH